MFKGLHNSIHKFLSFPRLHKRVVTVLVDFVLLFTACWVALSLRLGAVWEPLFQYWLICLLAPLVAMPFMIRMGLYRAIIRYIGYRALWACAKAVTLAVIVWALLLTLADINAPRSVIIIYWLTALVFVSGTRMSARWLIRQLTPVGNRNKLRNAQQVIIYGAGASGRQLATAMIHSPELHPIAFIDDDTSLQGMEINSLKIHAVSQLEGIIRDHDAEAVLLAMPSLSKQRRLEIVKQFEGLGIRVLTLPGMADLALGNVEIGDIREIDVTDLLGREQVRPNKALLSACITQKSVMVTGAGGSIGSELCRQILQQKPSYLVLFELTEYALYIIEKELTHIIDATGLDIQLVPIIGSVQDRKHLEAVMTSFKVETVYHAAAYKHVPLVEHNVISGIRNNVFGTWNTAEAAIASGVNKFVLVSTDKAVRPTNVMGGTKRLAEIVLQGISQREGSSDEVTRFAIVRFGNVLGSSGSVIPLFRKQINAGGPLTVTHPEITRYFMTIPEAAALVIQAGSIGDSGDVFVLDMGEPVKIVDLARQMVGLAGRSVKDDSNPDGDIEITYSGLRPGEKLYEELLIGDDVTGTQHSMIMRASEVSLSWDDVKSLLQELDEAIDNSDYERIRDLMLQSIQGYQPKDSILDYLSVNTTGNVERIGKRARL